jgi:hypothetical protein
VGSVLGLRFARWREKEKKRWVVDRWPVGVVRGDDAEAGEDWSTTSPRQARLFIGSWFDADGRALAGGAQLQSGCRLPADACWEGSGMACGAFVVAATLLISFS